MVTNSPTTLHRAQKWLGIGGLLGFLALLGLSLALHQPSLSRLMVIPQVVLLAAMSGLSSFFFVGTEKETPGMTLAMGVLFPVLGLLVVIGLL